MLGGDHAPHAPDRRLGQAERQRAISRGLGAAGHQPQPRRLGSRSIRPRRGPRPSTPPQPYCRAASKSGDFLPAVRHPGPRDKRCRGVPAPAAGQELAAPPRRRDSASPPAGTSVAAVGLHFQPLGQGGPKSVPQSKINHRPASTVRLVRRGSIQRLRRPGQLVAPVGQRSGQPAGQPVARHAPQPHAFQLHEHASRGVHQLHVAHRHVALERPQRRHVPGRPPRDDRTTGTDPRPSARRRRFLRRRRATRPPSNWNAAVEQSRMDLVVVQPGRRRARRAVRPAPRCR